MNIISSKEYFPNSEKIPAQLFLRGTLNNFSNKRVAVVGTRKPSLYGKAVVQNIISGLKGFPVSIVSGLAIGIDSLAHEAALTNGIHTIAIPGSGINEQTIYPKTNVRLAERILESGGALLSLWENQNAAPWTFPARNSVMASISDLVIIIEAQEDSGTMITAREALKRNIKLGAIPQNIDNVCAVGPNNLIKNGAHCITSSDDIIQILGFTKSSVLLNKKNSDNPILKYISKPIHRDELLLLTCMSISNLNIELTMLEINGEISIDNNGFIRIK